MTLKPETRNPKIITIIPAKPFTEAKTRLAGVLSTRARTRLSRHLLRRTITVARTVGTVAVVSRSAAVRRWAKAHGAWALVEAAPDLNAAIGQGIAWAEQHGADAVLVLPLDLPLLSPTDLDALIAQINAQPTVVIAPCRRETGTNALLLRPPAAIDPTFGANSFRRHRAAAEAAGVSPIIFRAPGLAFDLDTPQDWEDYRHATKFVRQPDEFSGV